MKSREKLNVTFFRIKRGLIIQSFYVYKRNIGEFSR